MSDNKSLENLVTQVRRDILRMVHKVNSGHPGGSLGCAEFLVTLYNDIMKLNDGFSMDGKEEDVFFLSNGHISPVIYSVLARIGYFPVDELNTFRLLDSRLQGHPTTHEGLPGIRIASGSLGQGMSVAIGTALTKKLNGDQHIVYSLHGDGELQEGQIWEGMMFAAHKNLDNIIVTVDWNGQQIDGANDDVLSLGDLEAKWLSFGWEVLHMNGNNMANVLETLAEAKTKIGKNKPVVILMKTDMGHGVDFMSGTHHWHGKPPNDEQKDIALAQLEETLGDYPL